MFAKTFSLALKGIEGVEIDVEVDISSKMPKFIIVGLPDTAVREAKDRVKAAMINAGYRFPYGRIVINLAPGDIKKQGPQYDLPIALGLMMASGQLPGNRQEKTSIIGELALDGSVRPVKGVFSMIQAASLAGKKYFVCPQENAAEAAASETLAIYPVRSLAQAIHFFTISELPAPFQLSTNVHLQNHTLDYSDVSGQEFAKRALLIVAAGRHHCIMVGIPGTGKSMLAARLSTILPSLKKEESVETTKVYSIAGMLSPEQYLIHSPPFCSPHHSISGAGLIGGGSNPRPGEISLAHNGVLFLDELPEFQKKTLENLRQPLEMGKVSIVRVRDRMTYPANFLLVAAMNPCPCGYHGDSSRRCQCSPRLVEQYRRRVSGPLLDRFDLHIQVPKVSFHELAKAPLGTNSSFLREKVIEARKRQEHRLKKHSLLTNSQMTVPITKKYCKLDQTCSMLLEEAVQNLGFSARAYQKILRLSLTIADLDGKASIHCEHLMEALQYRSLDREIS